MSNLDPKTWLHPEVECEGYTNYATAGVALWLKNNQQPHNDATNAARGALVAVEMENADDWLAVVYVAKYLKERIEQVIEKSRVMVVSKHRGYNAPDLVSTLLVVGMERVNWEEIAYTYVVRAKEEIAAANSSEE